ncbi:AMP-binding protein [Streptomyces pathocidini]|uniref:AMP-binding protein n=1 Tax=Streptomyces pathocidini TaxID=1650571 RepID=A0ABW7UPQ7_9ACTN|nr:AMP-binding protein [Streptomyces pathocidini]
MPSRTFLTSFAAHARRAPDSPALTWHGREVSYGELAGLVEQLRRELPAHAGPKAPVCLRVRKSPAAIALVIACLADGRAVLLPSAELGADTFRELAAASGADRILSLGEAVHAGGYGGLTAEAVEPAPGAPRVPEDARLLLTTSGSTGLPKVVPLRLDGVEAFTAWAAEQFGLGPGSRVLSYAPLNFDLSLLDIWTTLAVGGCTVLVAQDRATDGAHLRELLAGGVGLVQAVPMAYRLLRDAGPPEEAVFPGVRQVVFTGDAMPPRLLAALPAMFPEAALHNLYGCTETNDSLMLRLDSWPYETGAAHRTGEPDGAGAAPAGGALPLGLPLPGVRALLVRPGSLDPVEGPGTGELLVHTPFQAHGYLDPELSRGRFVTRRDPDGATRAYFRSGDLVSRDAEGTLRLVGRADFQVKVRGVRINLEEVERVLLAHPEVAEAVVVPLPDEVAGNRLHALVRRSPGTGLNSLTLRAHCARRLARTALPAELVITDEALPQGPTGKTDRARVRSLRLNS